jgi:hypothetical protein
MMEGKEEEEEKELKEEETPVGRQQQATAG